MTIKPIIFCFLDTWFKLQGDSKRFRQIVDLFQIPELFAWCSVLDYLQSTQNTPHPVLVYEDIKNVTSELHVHGTLHSHIMSNIEEYIEPNPELVDMLVMLRKENKQLFILTNRLDVLFRILIIKNKAAVFPIPNLGLYCLKWSNRNQYVHICIYYIILETCQSKGLFEEI